jgi:hypothetical protein
MYLSGGTRHWIPHLLFLRVYKSPVWDVMRFTGAGVTFREASNHTGQHKHRGVGFHFTIPVLKRLHVWFVNSAEGYVSNLYIRTNQKANEMRLLVRHIISCVQNALP